VKRPKSRTRKLFVTDELVELFRKAIPAEQALWREVVTGKEVMTEEQRSAARAAVYAFDRATDRKPWEHSPLSPRANGPCNRRCLPSSMEWKRRRGGVMCGSGGSGMMRRWPGGRSMTDWQDQLAERVRELEAGIDGHDRLLAARARSMLRILRTYELRLHRLSVRARTKFSDLLP
jgi:hypothetical protein